MRTRIAVVGCAVLAVVVAVVAAAVVLAAPVQTSTSGWRWGSPRPQGHELRAVEFAGARGYAGGDFGTLLRTDDGGTSWSGIRTGVPVRLRHLRVIDADSFLAAGSCTLLRSDDGGQTVRRLDLPGPRTCRAPVAGLDFLTAKLGYVLRGNRAVLRTTDGGATFTARAPLPAGGGPPNAIRFTSATVGVAVAGRTPTGRIFRTTDGGASWAQVFSGHAVNDVFFVSPTTGYAVGSRLILRTDDGGVTWAPKPTPEATMFSTVDCADELHCITATVGGTIVYSDDGFETHHNSKPSFVTEATGVGGNDAAFSTPDRVVAVGRAGRTFTSDDGGKTFDTAYIRSFRADSLAAGPGEVGYAFGSRGRVARTTDGGQTWRGRKQTPTSRPIDGWWIPTLGGVIAIDRQGFLFRSDDGGGSWAELGKASPERPRALWSSKDRQTVLIAGPFGLRRSTDGGASFSDTRTELLGGIQATGNRGAEVNVFGPQTLLRTRDGGATFTALGRPPGTLAEVDFVTTKVGFALTRDARLWRTDNAGGRWRELAGLGPYRLVGLGSYLVNGVMSFRANQDGSIAGSLVARDFGGTGTGFGWILHTSDGGASWRPQLVDDQPVRGIVQYPGDAHSNALTHPRPNSNSYYSPNRIFFTTTGGDSGRPSSITLTAQAAPNGRVGLTGHLAPKVAGAKVAVFARGRFAKEWRTTFLRTDPDGRFFHSLPRRQGWRFVAQWVGDAIHRGDGSRVLVWKP